ncbi:LiaI-LiaF-like domain-containing protein [Saccharicrinis aurantiacus]|uniref:LiaI-LiaF-like domain-containing protein n=1 Tax=Saccharicrinis aurantiacus TaxID=1849719 RepID=UPI00094F6464|nr:DUF5668 domain-containing protein [Saccharicrinis aurantiacus]
MEKQDQNRQKVAGGLILIIAGVALLLRNSGMVPPHISYTFFGWPSILILVGIFNFAKGAVKPAIMLFLVGGFFITSRMFPAFNVFQFWPVLLIVAGIAFFFGNDGAGMGMFSTGKVSNQDLLNDVSVFGGNNKRIQSDSFKGGQIVCVFGGSELMLNESTIAPEGANIELVAIFGGAKITVPRDWTVRTEVVSIFGAFSDKRYSGSAEGVNPDKVLTIKGVTIFGGGELFTS